MTKIMQDPLPTKRVHNLIIVDESGQGCRYARRLVLRGKINGNCRFDPIHGTNRPDSRDQSTRFTGPIALIHGTNRPDSWSQSAPFRPCMNGEGFVYGHLSVLQ